VTADRIVLDRPDRRIDTAVLYAWTSRTKSRKRGGAFPAPLEFSDQLTVTCLTPEASSLPPLEPSKTMSTEQYQRTKLSLEKSLMRVGLRSGPERAFSRRRLAFPPAFPPQVGTRGRRVTGGDASFFSEGSLPTLSLNEFCTTKKRAAARLFPDNRYIVTVQMATMRIVPLVVLIPGVRIHLLRGEMRSSVVR
jgi:hypothetical protein